MKLTIHEIDGDFANDDWAFFRTVTGHELDVGSLEGSLRAILDERDKASARAVNYPSMRFDPRDGLSVYVDSHGNDDDMLMLFEFKPVYGSKEVKIRFKDEPFDFGDMGWDISKFVKDVTVMDDNRRAYFVLDMKAMKATSEFAKAGEHDAPFVRFPIIYRVVDSHYPFPPGMIPNHHSLADLTRFGDSHHHDHGPAPLLRHWGPHFMDSYSVYVKLP